MSLTTSEFVNMLSQYLIMRATLEPNSGIGIINGVFNAAGTIKEIWPLLKDIFGNFIGLFSDLSQVIHILDFLPSQWVGLMLLLLGIVITLRVYAFFSDVEIGGFKI